MTRKYSQRSLKNLKGIHPDLRRVIDRALAEGPLDFIVIEGLRTVDRQRQLVKSGASQTMNSRHLTGHAVDLLPIGPNGAEFAWPLYDRLGPAIERIADEEGVKIVWGGRWKSLRDGPHFQLDHKAYPASEWTSGDEPPKPRTKPIESKTVKASAATIAGGAGTAISAVSGLDQHAQYIVLGFAGLVMLAGLFILRERLKSWADGWR